MNSRRIGSFPVSSIGLGCNNFGFVPDLPAAPIYRFLGEPGFARNFQLGEIRLSTFRRCRTIEDKARRDAGEGSRSHKGRRVVGVAGVQEIAVEFQSEVTVEHAFVLCFTQRNDSFARDRFGRFGVEVLDPTRLFSDLTNAIKALGFRVVLATASRVGYRNRAFIGEDLPPPLTEFLKPPQPYAEEQEVRFVWRLVSDPGVESLDVVLAEAPLGCRLLDDQPFGDPSGAEAPSG